MTQPQPQQKVHQMTYREQLTQRVSTEWESNATPIDPDSGRGFDPITIVMAILGFLSSCLRPPTPAPPVAAGRAASDDDMRDGGQVTIGLKRHLRKQYREDYGRRGARREWDANGARSLAVARNVASGATNQEVEGLRAEMGRTAAGVTEANDDESWDNG